MGTNNDTRIIELKKQIEEKKKELLTKKTKFTPDTNCVIEFNGVTYNLNVIGRDALVNLMINLNLYIISAKDLNIPIPLISGYSVDVWISDIKSKLEVLNTKKEETELTKLETKLDKMLSDDKKTELELDDIAALLK